MCPAVLDSLSCGLVTSSVETTVQPHRLYQGVKETLNVRFIVRHSSLAALELTVHISQASNLTLLFLPPGCWECKHVQAGWAVKRLHMWVCMGRSGGSFGVVFPQLYVDSGD